MMVKDSAKIGAQSERSACSYVLITPVKDEENTIEYTIQSVIKQTLPPQEWVIVSDQSTDSTDEIVQRYAATHKFINFIRVQGSQERSFSSVVHVIETGLKALKSKNYNYIGVLDGDVRFDNVYFEILQKHFVMNTSLGLAGGLVIDYVNGTIIKERQYMKNVAGATQFYRRECFESLGGLVAIPEGGWDAITCVVARINGFQTATFPDLIVEHLKPKNVSQGNPVSRKWQMGIREYALGSHPFFVVIKCLARSLEPPIIIGAAAWLVSFIWCCFVGRDRMISPQLIKSIRNEQIERILPKFISHKKNWHIIQKYQKTL
jgi:glycosyltransferase involved in cell wall biosynthesis